MDPANTSQRLASGRAEEKNLNPGHGAGPSRPSSMSHAHSPSDETTFSLSKQENEAGSARHATDPLRVYVPELPEGQGESSSTPTSQEFELFREGIARLEKAITDLKPTSINDPTTNFWTVYKKVADEQDNDLLKKYTGDLDTSLLFAGLFSAVSTTFIVQIIPSLQPNPSDITNSLLLHILQRNESFGGLDPLQPTMQVPLSVVSAQGLLFASLSVTLFVAFLAVLGKQWILYYTQASTLGSIVERGKERQHKFVGLRKWKLHLVMEALPVLLQISLLLFTIGLIVYLWDIDVSAAGVILAVTCIGFMVYTFITVAATFWSNCPFQTPLSVVLRRVMSSRNPVALPAAGASLKQRSSSLLVWINNGCDHLVKFIKRLRKVQPMPEIPLDQDNQSVYARRYEMALSNPIFWRPDPLFTTPLENDAAASAGFWLLETSTDISAATAVAAVFSEFQWPSDHHSETALVRLRDTYTECFRAPKFDNSTRLQALQSAAAYYVLYHSWLIRSTSRAYGAEVEKPPPDLAPDLLLHNHNSVWGGDDLFEYLLHLENRSELVESARFLSYIAPYWFCGASDSAVRFRSNRLQTSRELIEVLDASHALDPATFTDCVLCVGAAMDFPLHPEDLIRANKSDYLTQTFKMVVEHIHRIDLWHSRRHHHTTKALGILLDLFKLKSLPLFNAVWITRLLRDAAVGKMSDNNFILFLRLSAGRKDKEVDIPVDAETGDYHLVQDNHVYPPFPGGTTSGTPNSNHILFKKIMQNVQKRVTQEEGWQDEAIYGGLISIRDIHLVDPSLFDRSVLQMMHDAMDAGKPFRVRKAAYDVMFVTRDLWLKSGILRQDLQNLGFFKRLHGVVDETARPDYHLSFLMMVETLSENGYWHPHLREIMEIWLHLRHAGPEYTLLILARVGNFSLSERKTYNTSIDDLLPQLIAEEWKAVPGRPVEDLTVEQLEPLVEVTEQFKELLFEDLDRRTVLGVVGQVIPTLERRRDIGDHGLGEDVRGLIDGLLGKLQLPRSQPSRLLSSDE